MKSEMADKTTCFHPELLETIETFCKEHDMGFARFGESVMNDRNFVRRLKKGRKLYQVTVDRIVEFMENYHGEQAANAFKEA